LSEEERIAGATFLEIHDAHRRELEVREQPGRGDFNFYLVGRVSNNWVMPALRLLNHRSALYSFAEGADMSRLRAFIECPDEVLAEERYAEKMRLLVEMQQRYEDMRNNRGKVLQIGFRRMT
jgi:hypothetical protein